MVINKSQAHICTRMLHRKQFRRHETRLNKVIKVKCAHINILAINVELHCV